MLVDITVPELGESISEVEIGEWLVEVGSRVEADEELVALESEKATVELPAPRGGVLVEILKKQGEVAAIGEVIARVETNGKTKEKPAAEEEDDSEKDAPEKRGEEPAPTEGDHGDGGDEQEREPDSGERESPRGGEKIMPAAARILAERGIAPEKVTPTGPDGRILKEDALRAAEETEPRREPAEEGAGAESSGEETAKEERRVRMTPIRRTIAARLLEATQNMALLTTFNEADMSAVKQARAELGEAFEQKHGVRLGFMSFFVKAAVASLLDFPQVNARIDGSDIVYRRSCDIGVAIGSKRGLVVPVIRGAEKLSFADIEKEIAEYAEKAGKNALTLKELEGGSFTISNGGVYGSMLSTPIVNPPQSAILGLHAINDRPVAIEGEVRIRPMMYLALSYDHRIIDGSEAVTFLKRIKERIEQPRKLLLEI